MTTFSFFSFSSPIMADEKASCGRFSGEPEDHYRKEWRKKAKAYLFGLPDTISPVKYGSRLTNLLDGEAEDICRHLIRNASPMCGIQ